MRKIITPIEESGGTVPTTLYKPVFMAGGTVPPENTITGELTTITDKNATNTDNPTATTNTDSLDTTVSLSTPKRGKK